MIRVSDFAGTRVGETAYKDRSQAERDRKIKENFRERAHSDGFGAARFPKISLRQA